jgi:hypothetical protein
VVSGLSDIYFVLLSLLFVVSFRAISVASAAASTVKPPRIIDAGKVAMRHCIVGMAHPPISTVGIRMHKIPANPCISATPCRALSDCRKSIVRPPQKTRPPTPAQARAAQLHFMGTVLPLARVACSLHAGKMTRGASTISRPNSRKILPNIICRLFTKRPPLR